MAQTGGSFISRRIAVTELSASVPARDESLTVPPNLRQLTPGPVSRLPVTIDSWSPSMVAALASSVNIRPDTALLMLSQRIEEFTHANAEIREEIADSLTIALFLGGEPLLRELMLNPDSGRQLRLIWVLGSIANDGVMPRVIVARAQALLLRPEVLALLGDSRAPGRYELVNALWHVVRNPIELAPEFVERAGAALLQPVVLGLLKNMLSAPRLAFVEMLVQMARNKLTGCEALSGQAAEAILRPEVTGLLREADHRLHAKIIEGIGLVAQRGPPEAVIRAMDILIGPEVLTPLYDLDALVMALANVIKGGCLEVSDRALRFLLDSGDLTHFATIGCFLKLVDVLQFVVAENRNKGLVTKAAIFLKVDPVVCQLVIHGAIIKKINKGYDARH